MTQSRIRPAPSELTFAAEVADLVAPIALRHFRTTLRVDRKNDDSPVTIADRIIESTVRARIMAAYPEHGILGEEEGPLNLERQAVWVVDPIDGTKSFVTGHPLFGNLLALLMQGRPVLGQIDMPVLGERWQGLEGQESTFNGAPCRTSGCVSLSEAHAYTTDPNLFRGRFAAAHAALVETVRLVRYGGDCYSYGLLASGHCDLVLETGLQPYDYLPLVQIIEGAGGVITDWSGAVLGLQSSGEVLASATPELHDAMLNRLAAAMTPLPA
jgi:inositol-phosphate phosphatase/L-galactose 1-phosphate phosphatase/histidinol-phosphatase